MAVLWVLIAVAALTLAAAIDRIRVPSYDINLDLPPKERWKEYVRLNRDVLAAQMEAWGENVDKAPLEKRNSWMGHHHFKPEHLEELVGYHEALNDTRFKMHHVISLQMVYAMSTFHRCSGVAAATANGTVVHGRNLDYGSNRLTLKDGREIGLVDMVEQVTFHKGGRPIVVSMSFAGYIGIHTGMRLVSPRLTFEQNTHYDNNEDENRAAAERGGIDFGLFARELLEGSLAFPEAVQKVSQTSFNAPQYFVLAGEDPWQAVTIEVRRAEPDPGLTHAEEINPTIGRWFLVQANNQAWIDHDDSDGRRDFGVQLMSSLGQSGVTVEMMERVMRTPPLFNQLTLFTTVMVPATGFYEVYTREDKPPRLQAITMAELSGDSRSKSFLEPNRTHKIRLN